MKTIKLITLLLVSCFINCLTLQKTVAQQTPKTTTQKDTTGKWKSKGDGHQQNPDNRQQNNKQNNMNNNKGKQNNSNPPKNQPMPRKDSMNRKDNTKTPPDKTVMPNKQYPPKNGGPTSNMHDTVIPPSGNHQHYEGKYGADSTYQKRQYNRQWDSASGKALPPDK